MAKPLQHLLALAFLLAAHPFEAQAAKSVAELYPLYLSRDYFELEKQLPGVDHLDPRRAFFEGQLDAAFLRDEQADLELRRFLALPTMEADWRKEAWWTLGKILLRRGNYEAAEEAVASALAEPAAKFTAAERIIAEQDLAIAKVLRGTPAQNRSPYQGPSTVNVTRGTSGRDGGMIYVDFRVNGLTETALFDTGANGNVASESFARRHRLHLLPERVNVMSGVGQEVSSRLGVADEVRIGNMVFHHVVFYVLADEALVIPETGLSTDAVVGMPLILPMDHLRFTADVPSLEIGLPAEPESSAPALPRNLAFDGPCLLVSLRYQGEAIPFFLDSGSDRTELFVRFSQRFPQVLKEVKIRIDPQYGLGSKKDYTVQILPRFGLSAGEVSASLHATAVHTEDLPFYLPGFGIVGEDFLVSGFELDFRRMSFSLVRPSSP